ncbi:hypothetical protein BjapCC829_48955 (plasmid) [Bradyrhizobium barranii]|uniref:Uncharacterized protein n=1 Tax=Bradyrhizobium barranii TaxID=2992140 RepID=A0ABY3R0Y5_9BRAD|nr:hypothetical protein [Bradyrhizobium japonicum]UFW91938.1 hypothetical protein BjapCC829_48955 [Bradyrhizobium japonicum]
MDEFAMLLANRCRTEFQHLQNELNLATGAGPTDIAALQHAARRMSGIAARLESVTRAISNGTASGAH